MLGSFLNRVKIAETAVPVLHEPALEGPRSRAVLGYVCRLGNRLIDNHIG
jgi:hypothetical protein